MQKRVYPLSSQQLKVMAENYRQCLLVLSEDERLEVISLLSICCECGADLRGKDGQRVKCWCMEND